MSLQLALHQVTVAYPGGRTVVDGFSLTLDAGRLGCLLGPSGCGKTTVLRAVAGFEPVQAGEVRLGDVVLSSARVHVQPERRRVGLMFQDYALFPHLTAAENIAFGLRRLVTAAQRARVDELLRLVDLPDAGRRYPHELSGGQQQRVALARALAPRPELLLLDEPFSNLDGTTRERLTVEVRDILHQAGQTALLVTHNLAEARTFADAMGTMHSGRLSRWDPVPPASPRAD